MMQHCFALAAKAAAQGEYAYDAVVVRNDEIVAETTMGGAAPEHLGRPQAVGRGAGSVRGGARGKRR